MSVTFVVCLFSLTDFEERDELGQGDHQEEHVEEELEFVVEHFWNKRKHIELLVVQLVRWEAVGGASPVELEFTSLLRDHASHGALKAIPAPELLLHELLFVLW